MVISEMSTSSIFDLHMGQHRFGLPSRTNQTSTSALHAQGQVPALGSTLRAGSRPLFLFPSRRRYSKGEWTLHSSADCSPILPSRTQPSRLRSSGPSSMTLGFRHRHHFGKISRLVTKSPLCAFIFEATSPTLDSIFNDKTL